MENPEAERYFGVKCPECGHVTYFDKAEECAKRGTVRRGDSQLNELNLVCEQCRIPMTAVVDCAGYR